MSQNISSIYRRTQPVSGIWTIIDRATDEVIGHADKVSKVYTGLKRGAIYTYQVVSIDGPLSNPTRWLKAEGDWDNRTWVLTERKGDAYLFDSIKEGMEALYSYYAQPKLHEVHEWTPLTDGDDYAVYRIEKGETILDPSPVYTGTWNDCDDYIQRNESPDNNYRYKMMVTS